MHSRKKKLRPSKTSSSLKIGESKCGLSESELSESDSDGDFSFLTETYHPRRKLSLMGVVATKPKSGSYVKFGYTIPVSSLTEDELTTLKKAMTIEKRNPFAYSVKVQRTELFRMSPDETTITVSRYLGNKFFGPAEKDLTTTGAKRGKVKFIGKLRNCKDYRQKDASKSVLNTMMCTSSSSAAQAFMVKPCGSGKTITSINIVYKMGLRALFIFGTTQQLDQFKDSISGDNGREACLKNVRVGVMGMGEKDVVDKDILLATAQTLYRYKDLPEDEREAQLGLSNYGVVVLDECQQLPTNMFVSVVQMIPAKYRLFMTATPERDDGISLNPFSGPVTYTQPFVWRYVRVCHVDFHSPSHSGCDLYRSVRGKAKPQKDSHAMLKRMVEDNVRNSFLLEIICRAVEDGRDIICLSRSVQHLKDMCELVNEELPPEIGSDVPTASYIDAKTKRTDRSDRFLSRVIFGSYQLLHKAFDKKSISVVLKMTPASGKAVNIQTDGRARAKGTKPPIVIDVVDSTHSRSFSQRRVTYCNFGYEYTHIVANSKLDASKIEFPEKELTEEYCRNTWKRKSSLPVKKSTTKSARSATSHITTGPKKAMLRSIFSN